MNMQLFLAHAEAGAMGMWLKAHRVGLARGCSLLMFLFCFELSGMRALYYTIFVPSEELS